MNTDGHMKRTRKRKHTTKSSSSGPTALSTMPKDVLDLGPALVEELGLDPGVDTLSRWMAHYIAELIEAAETAKAEDRPAKLAKCADAILDLWERRHQLPNGKRPFEDLEPILRALESLDPNDDTPRYFRSPRTAANETEQNPETRKWLELADGLDYSAKILIRHCLTQAAKTALDKSKDWVALAKAAGLDDGIDLQVIRIITDESDLLKASDPDDIARRRLEDRIKRLDGFMKVAESLVSDLRRQLKQAHAPKRGS
jgi:hypothetical protein